MRPVGSYTKYFVKYLSFFTETRQLSISEESSVPFKK
jgi:hypothetical protein